MTSRPCSSRATAPVGSRDVAASVAVSRPRHCNQTWARTPSNVRGPSASHRTGCGLARQLRVLPRPQNASSRGPRAFPAAKKGRAGLFRNYYEFLVPKRCYPQNVRRPPMRAHGTVEYSPKRVLLAKPGLIAVGLSFCARRQTRLQPAAHAVHRQRNGSAIIARLQKTWPLHGFYTSNPGRCTERWN